jgi:lysophospholipase L1-like esterase
VSSRYHRFVAIGDSQTEGVGDHTHPDGTDRGWADRFAEAFTAHAPGLLYANLAIRGRRIGRIHDEQLEPALALKPDLASVMAGANDLIRPSLDLGLTLSLMDDMQVKFRSAGATVITNTYPVAPGSGPFGHRVADRFRAYNEGLREIARRNGALLIDLETIPATTDPRLWSHDRLHLNPEGHDRLAQGVFTLVEGATDGGAQLTLDSFAPGEVPWWATQPPAAEPGPRASEIRQDLGWVFRYLLPWIGRRATGRSSGDGRAAKRPLMAPAAELSGPARRAAGPVSG